MAQDGVIAPGERLVVACSGGSDSVALAAILAGLASEMRLSLLLVHVNHGLRKSSWQDEAVVLRVSAAVGVPVRVVALSGLSDDEATLRAARYDGLADAAVEFGAQAVVTGHNAEDQTETLLLALFRGTGPRGLAGMPARRSLSPGIDLARPLLRFGRSSLRRYCEVAGLPYAIDPSNADLELRRNAVRHALQALRPLFPGLDEAAARTATLVSDELEETPSALGRKQIRQALSEEGGLTDIDFTHVEAALKTLERGGTGRFFMKDGVELQIERGRLTVHRAP
ncbi:MAG: tRNA lysidine(34) synthetase TilS [Candidatus Eremiobacteraeota bacterium]|nr:tRNA lysidine(34) synthetase TilS [Candidatus Eremiobacteraeota bacterium]